MGMRLWSWGGENSASSCSHNWYWYSQCLGKATHLHSGFYPTDFKVNYKIKRDSYPLRSTFLPSWIPQVSCSKETELWEEWGDQGGLISWLDDLELFSRWTTWGEYLTELRHLISWLHVRVRSIAGSKTSLHLDQESDVTWSTPNPFFHPPR